ncbi:MAG: putative hydrolase of the superfamily [Chloroflexota bacterium]|jgi:HAD superfamily hydrolase (TIGR01549 family)|nr:putative hydrolase of the superfamily [Chloroflexota bacterium]
MTISGPVSTVLFDYGHTLMDFTRPEEMLLEAYHNINRRLEEELEGEVPAAHELLQSVSLRVDDEIGDSYLGGAEQEVDIAALYNQALAALGMQLRSETVQWVVEEEQRAWLKGIAASPHAHDVLGRLKNRGLRLGIVSNAAFPPNSMRAQLASLGLAPYFDATVYSSEIGLRKPNRAIYEECVRRLGGAGDGGVVFVGDRLREDVFGPRKLGFDAVLTHEFRREQPFPGMDVQVIKSLDELPALIPG